MIARVKKNEFVYDTVVFAFLTDGWETKVIGFNETFQTLEYLSFYKRTLLHHICQQIVIIDNSDTEWVKNNQIEGFDWLINDQQLLDQIKAGDKIPNEILSRCLQLQSSIHCPEWFAVTDEKTAENLLTAGGYFHDGYIENLAVENDETLITMGVWGGNVHFRLKDAKLSPNIQIGYGHLGEIFGSNIFFEDDRIFWTSSENATCQNELCDDDCYFSATNVLWNIELN